MDKESNIVLISFNILIFTYAFIKFTCSLQIFVNTFKDSEFWIIWFVIKKTKKVNFAWFPQIELNKPGIRMELPS